MMSFATLPTELRLRIITESIEAHPAILSSSATTAAAVSNVQQAITLAQVSRICHAIVVELLYHTIRITHPSSLLELRATLESSPRLALLIVNLHIGAVGELVARGWPIVEGRGPPSRIGCSIQTTLSEGECPSWCKEGATFNIKFPEIRARTIAVDDALRDAMRDIDVEPQRRGWSDSGKHIGVRKWAERLFLLQAALDIYLIEIRRLEEAVDRAALIQDHGDGDSSLSLEVEYPRLKILLHPLPRKASTDEAGSLLIVTTQQLWGHLLNGGGPADHFDHLVRLTRSTRQGLGMTSKEEWSRVRHVLSGPNVRERDEGDEEEGEKQGQPGSEDEDALEGSASPLSEQGHPLDGHRVEDLIGAARDILGLTSSIKSLSLTSYFHRALSSPAPPTSLRSLAIGPRTLYWDDVLPSTKCLAAFKSLKRLRVVGKITEDDAFKLAYEMPSLSEVEWEMPDRSIERSSRTYDTINLLQGPQGTKDQDATGDIFKAEAVAAAASSSSSPQSSSSSSSRLNTIRLHPHNIVRVFFLAAFELEKREAWKKGTSVPGTLHRVKVADSDVVTSPEKMAVWEEKDFGTLMKGSLVWWEQGGNARGRGD